MTIKELYDACNDWTHDTCVKLTFTFNGPPPKELWEKTVECFEDNGAVFIVRVED